jgi:hypothetical protein
MPVLRLMENLLAIEAEAKVLLSASDRSHEQKLMQELKRILKEAELMFGPRDASFQLSVPRLTECTNSRTFIFRPLKMTRIYLSRESKTGYSLLLVHEISKISRNLPLIEHRELTLIGFAVNRFVVNECLRQLIRPLANHLETLCEALNCVIGSDLCSFQTSKTMASNNRTYSCFPCNIVMSLMNSVSIFVFETLSLHFA